MVDLKVLGQNIHILRVEARLSVSEFASMANVPVELVESWEKGLVKPYIREFLVICPILKISEEDLTTRDILSERQNASKNMKTSNDRVTYDWYYGSKKRKVLYILALCLIPSVFILSLLYHIAFLSSLNDYVEPGAEEIYTKEMITVGAILMGYLTTSICGLVFIIIDFFRYIKRVFRFWMIFILSAFIPLIILSAAISLIPYYVYTLYRLITFNKKSKIKLK